MVSKYSDTSINMGVYEKKILVFQKFRENYNI